ncbi:L-serine ammonia-lyase, iron-sulfur-dependent, subunit alpha [Microbacterium horticulturae]|uniref:L-serine ammonia-lyase n=1 Tax=Microbacterium horticulturae TaxID=3028316 RepID=A0ABY8C2J6_9MICO|nr:L-serine ammonia-lyase, iron-sulfur-dependent, subunit alpha [Microbacterium sp. KACC 23027]WEG09562.1 L-serine ammonia-lyase, iron-sulfur-dependent, subunit alpha [Microbacterium sp. KACC 23027]
MSAYVSAFELFSIGVGPSSSHTVGPMRAARDFAVRAAPILGRTSRVTCTLFGSLGATGLGHGTPDAVVAGLRGDEPETVDPDALRRAWSDWPDGGRLRVNGTHEVAFAKDDIAFAPRTRMPGHPNALTLTALGEGGDVLAEETYYSVGGGFIRREGDATAAASRTFPFSFDTAAELLALCDAHALTIAEVARANEEALRSEEEVAASLDATWDAMSGCITAGLHADGVLPGILKVKRRAGALRAQLESAQADGGRELPGEWLGAFALAVNEENASGGRVVTAPTNGAAGIVPAVGMYWWRFLADSGLGAARAVTPDAEPVGSALLGESADVAEANRRRGIRRYLLTAAALGSLFKANASISGAEGGCQAEVGSACAMAAAGLTAVMGGTNRQIENAAEIAMEHHLGLTCDPVAGLVQIPCIERNAIAASTAVTATRLALRGDGSHYVPLDTVVETMRQTGIDMSTKYKETSEGGLAVNVVEC